MDCERKRPQIAVAVQSFNIINIVDASERKVNHQLMTGDTFLPNRVALCGSFLVATAGTTCDTALVFQEGKHVGTLTDIVLGAISLDVKW